MFRGLEFCIPHTNVINEQVFTEFEMLFSQLNLHIPNSSERLSLCKTMLADLSCEYSSLPDDQDFLVWQWVHFQMIKFLKIRNDIYITKPDKESGVLYQRGRTILIKWRLC